MGRWRNCRLIWLIVYSHFLVLEPSCLIVAGLFLSKVAAPKSSQEFPQIPNDSRRHCKMILSVFHPSLSLFVGNEVQKQLFVSLWGTWLVIWNGDSQISPPNCPIATPVTYDFFPRFCGIEDANFLGGIWWSSTSSVNIAHNFWGHFYTLYWIHNNTSCRTKEEKTATKSLSASRIRYD